MGLMDLSTTSRPSFSFNRIGDVAVGIITEIDENVVMKDDAGEPRTSLVITLAVDASKCISHDREKDPVVLVESEERAVWVAHNRKRLVRALQEAVNESGAKALEIGGRLVLRYERNGEAKDKSFSPPKFFAARYTPPTRSTSVEHL